MNTYYNDTPRKVSFENKSLVLQEAKDYFLALSDHTASYIGFIDSYNEVIIFRWIGRNKWLLDHPVVPNSLHRQRYATKDECISFIEKVYQEYDISGFEGFEDVPIGEFTLDEILVFKKEDELLLREEEPGKPIIPPQKKPFRKQKTNTSPTLIMGEQLGSNKKKSPTPSQPKSTTPQPKNPSKSSDDGFFSI